MNSAKGAVQSCPDGLFDVFERTEMRYMKNGEHRWGYINQSARPGIAAAREMMQRWFAAYPKPKLDLYERLRSEDSHRYQARFLNFISTRFYGVLVTQWIATLIRKSQKGQRVVQSVLQYSHGFTQTLLTAFCKSFCQSPRRFLPMNGKNTRQISGNFRHVRGGRMDEVGIPIRARRRTLKIRQEDLAARIDLANNGIWQAGRRDFHHTEAGSRKVTDIELRVIARALDIQPCDLFT